MTFLQIDEKDNFSEIAKNVIEKHKPAVIETKFGNMVLMSEEDFRSIQSTLDLLAIPNLVKDVKVGKKELITDMSTRDDLPW